MDLLMPAQIERIYAVTAAQGCNRNFVVVPLATGPVEALMILPDGKVYLRSPPLTQFEDWLAGLPARVAKLDLARSRRPDA